MTEDTIVITGASGGIGGRVARRLAGTGARLRLVVRDPSRAPEIPGAEVAVTDFDDPDGLRRAFAGASRLLFVSAAEAQRRLDQHYRVTGAAAADVGHVVYTSFLGAAAEATFTLGRDHYNTERRIESSGLAHTFLRDSLYLDVLPYFVGADGAIRGPAGDGRFAPVGRDDVADAAAAILLDPKAHDGRTYDVTGPALLTMVDVVAQLAAVTGRPITYRPETLDEAYASRAAYGAPDWEVRGWVTSYAAIAAGEMAVVSDAVETLAGHQPASAAAWLRAHPESWRHLS